VKKIEVANLPVTGLRGKLKDAQAQTEGLYVGVGNWRIKPAKSFFVMTTEPPLLKIVGSFIGLSSPSVSSCRETIDPVARKVRQTI